MARQRNKEVRIFSSISDERLAVILARDYARSPSEFFVSATSDITDPKLFLRDTSARGVDPMKKWL